MCHGIWVVELIWLSLDGAQSCLELGALVTRKHEKVKVDVYQ